MDFAQPINGWEFLLTTVAGIVTTILSVWIGLRFALAQERKRGIAERVKEEVQLGRKIVGEAVEGGWGGGQSSIIGPFFGLSYPVWAAPAADTTKADSWDPSNFTSLVPMLLSGMPASQQAVADWTAATIAEFVEVGNREFPDASNEAIQAVAVEYGHKLNEPLTLYAKGRCDADWFASRL